MSSYRKLHVIAPGLYYDGDGGKFFYLTGMYAWMTQRLLDTPGLNVPGYFHDVFAQIRSDMEESHFVELTD